LKVVFVCSGNRFRSPIAEALFRGLAPDLPLDVSSRGTLDLGSVPVLPEALAEGGRLGLDLSAHRARTIAAGELADAELVIGFERRHVATAVVDGEAPRERTFTLPELVALLEQIERPLSSEPLEHAREALALVARERPDGSPVGVAELADPIGRGAAFSRETADRVQALTEALARSLFGRGRGDEAGGHEPAARSQPPASGGGEGEGQSTPPRRG
jgi:protein-tyrosine phosphatase